MAKRDDPDRYLIRRNGWWHYRRMVPKRLRTFYERGDLWVSLGTRERDQARERRDALAAADDEHWHVLKEKLRLEAAGHEMTIEDALKRYELAKARALSLGFRYKPAHELADPAMLEELVRRALAAGERSTSKGELLPKVVEAVLGGVAEPQVTVTKAMELYRTKIAVGELRQKSDAQKKLWEQTKERSVRYFVDVVGDLPMNDITREHAQTYFAWWNDEITPSDNNPKPKSPKTAARHFGDMRDLYRRYYTYHGEEGRLNPFRELNFKDKRAKRKKRPAFSDEWVRTRVLDREAWAGLSDELFLVTMILIETGCRPGEVINLRPQDIVLAAPVPHLVIPVRDDREIKAAESEREIPLVGVALEAARRAPRGFPKYHDKTNAFSAALGAAFKRRKLFETTDHVIYSFRHSFESRMKEAGVDYELRCLLMGHDIKRPNYGDGGSMAYRAKALEKIAHPYEESLFSAFAGNV
ncbi:DUF6538 domain-containing protein [Parvularcula maris]|uniref:Integrase n=1 Tax=Parvularcula maris TaxID=2965077 RepID=A0A9X2LB64_9PROT|nr:DUF6538 domain-containing protein [Parvularcula maris]MCQ8186447.1 integrase [Parvularcula maris]